MNQRNRPTASKKGDRRLGCIIFATLALVILFVVVITHLPQEVSW